MFRSRIVDIASYLPKEILHNDDLKKIYSGWSSEKIYQKTGIIERRIAAAHETAADLAFKAARKLFEKNIVTPGDIDFIILCTQTPDYFLPTTACLLQYRLGIPNTAGAFDINLGCSGFVYGLSVAKGLIETGSARRVLFLTADTYSKFIHPMDKSVRTLFGDGATATLIEASEKTDEEFIGPFVFGTDGNGANNIIVKTGGFRSAQSEQTAKEEVDDSGNVRSQDNLYMNGSEVIAFTLSSVPKAINDLLKKCGEDLDYFDYIVLHQANHFMLDALRKKINLPEEKFPVFLEMCGNTVSSSIPITLESMLNVSRLKRGDKLLLLGFGVGYSWAATAVKF
ncbi:3-oxoacyl-ACP synthase III family protein [Nostoc sphaeroides]|uniref:FabH, 3-oxoacyl-[acyl-carrier-protein] synthase III n=1 Tax=Nostoc sphaeroides CCNUC1 TaxID=2653204 RepID=A0A5P8VS74_9NOSO|nr:ketoacyl-ACP synthase III [Nostoc sphaeroides]QFS43161.1 fabH, 3-oxoacyl-[acyl-carrier-protein] synthase III [Nostoc sphaeroides CCNUC1]